MRQSRRPDGRQMTPGTGEAAQRLRTRPSPRCCPSRRSPRPRGRPARRDHLAALDGRAEFKARYRDARRQVVELAVTGLQQATGQAVETLVEITGNIAAPQAARVSAAKTILDFAVKGVELVDLAERVERLEAQVREERRP